MDEPNHKIYWEDDTLYYIKGEFREDIGFPKGTDQKTSKVMKVVNKWINNN